MATTNAILWTVVPIVALFLLTTFHSCGAKPKPGSWLWPNENPSAGAEGPNRQTLNKNQTIPTDFIKSRALFTFGTHPPAAHQTRTFPASLSSAFPTVSIENCTCVPYYLCDENQMVSDVAIQINIRLAWPCQTAIEVCCRLPHVTPSSPSMTVTTPTTDMPAGTIPPYVPQCGTLNPNGVHARVLGFKESETQFGEYPWQAAILEQRVVSGRWVLKFICGATLILPSVVITAAHCVQGRHPGNLIVRVGEWDTQSTAEFLPYQDLWGNEIVVHPLYYSGALINDIALIFLQQSAILSPHIDTICLPTASPAVSYDGTSCWATGWGKNAFGHGGQYQAILHEVELPIVPDNVCASLLRNTSLGWHFNFHSSYLCAGGLRGRDTCIGDGGGPLVCPSLANPWRFVLVGITSWGLGCGQYKIPGVYVRVAEFVSWIETQISLRFPSFDPRQLEIEIGPTNSSMNPNKPQQRI